MNEVTEIKLADEVLELLNPIEGDSAVGVEANTVEEYFNLNMEIGKITPNYKLCVELATIILAEKSKDVRVASWLCFSWFRLDGIVGFKNGLSLLLNLLQKFGENIHPTKINYRSKAIQFLNSSRFFKLLEKEEVTKSNAEFVLEAEKIFNSLLEECNKQFPEAPPVLKAIEQTIKDLSENANVFVKKSSADVPSENSNDKKLEQEKTKPHEEVEKSDTVEVSKASNTVENKKQNDNNSFPTNDKEAIVSIKKQIKYFFEDTNEDKKLKLPNEVFVYSISRSLVWDKLNLPPSKENITQIDPPNAVIQNKIVEWYSNKDWDVLVPRIELNFLNPDSGFQFWLDAQRYVVKALEEKGGSFLKVVDELKISLALLLNRFPQLLDLKFKNKETSFADNDTIAWIKNDVSSILGSGKSSEPMLLPPIMGEDYLSISEDYKKAFEELPENFEINIAKMQQKISGDTRRKGRFIRLLNLSNLCIEAKQFQLAKVHLLQLNNKIEEYNLAEWEPALSVAVWQSTYLVNNKLLETKDKELINSIELEQSKLFSKIANYDGVLAIKLSNKIGGK